MAEATKVRNHQWVQMYMVPLEVLPGSDGRPIVFIDDAKREVAERGANYGCFACHTPLEEGFGTECKGA